jgi:dUTP pyrophosphatase
METHFPSNLKVQIRKCHPDAVIPSYAKVGDAGLDLTAVDRYFDSIGNVVYHTGLCFEIPEGYVGLIFPRSSVCKYDLALTNAVGVIDSGYRGEVVCKFKPMLLYVDNPDVLDSEFPPEDKVYEGSIQTDINTQAVSYLGSWYGAENDWADKRGLRSLTPRLYEVGDRIAQMIILPYPKVEFEETNELSTSERGEGGYGSSGK